MKIFLLRSGLLLEWPFSLLLGLFFAFFYFPYQVLVLTFDKFPAFFLFFLPALVTVIALVTILCYMTILDSDLLGGIVYDYLWLSVIVFIFVVINNLFVLKTKFR